MFGYGLVAGGGNKIKDVVCVGRRIMGQGEKSGRFGANCGL